MSSFWLKAALSQWKTLPYPDEDCSGRTVIVTGANCGLGLEAARHLARLKAARVILACRDVDKAEAARRDIVGQGHGGAVEAWPLDLGSFDSVRAFAARAAALDRLDLLVNNASLLAFEWALLEGHEAMVTVNVLSTFLLTILLLPALRRTGARFNVMPHVVIVASDGAFMARFPQRTADQVLERLKLDEHLEERYNTTKLLQLMLMRRLAEASSAGAGAGGPAVVVNALNPGFCSTQLFRRLPFPFSLLRYLAFALAARSPEVGSRTLLAAAFAGEASHGRCMSDCVVRDEWPTLMDGDDGRRLADKLWAELGEVLEAVEPGVMSNV
ncbi:hypothetical protein CDD83_9619 [Cordyceps sp. RAO-2017]|nr:hypothetical protein CDD83_9619 [Cordyceps sp. RAO-2017]